ncbi:hypothetical protein BJ165DRAFT_128643 [Panaeolus papilionaceus]|nr:hypothetical protein BJ165DRAFT_128643 [Panaeolus papilionaceus]
MVAYPGIAQLKVKRTNDESSSIHIWRWLRSMRAKMEPNGDVKSLYKDEDHATDLLLVLNPLVKFLLGIQTLKDNDSKYLTLWDNSDYQNSHFFRETFRLLDPMLAPPLLSSSTELSVPLSPIFLLPSKYYRDFRRTGYVRDLQACANVLRRHVPMTKPVERYTGFESQSVLDRYARLQQEAANAGTSSVSGSSSILEVYPQLSRYKSTGADSEDYEPPEQRPVTFMPHNALVRDTLTATAPERRSTTSSIFTPSRYLAGDFGNHRVLHEPSLGVQAETQENTEITLPDIFIPSQIPPVWDPISAGKDLIPIPSPPWAGDEDILAKNKHRRYRPGVVLDMAEDLPEDQKMSSRGKERRRLHFHDRDSSTLARELEQTWSPRVSQADDSITTSMHVPSTSSSKKPCSSQPTILTDVTERFSLFE